ncbi:hypothetical protein MED297_18698 [Reinekea sp. MED297]|uniref:Uncharacterized protein n=2 Tax=Reinekea TaxID=230494 RepID=A4BF11_9GAMM|nr:hypothetical protein MED297_18698 [Reinekea sp. MED297] [Reinekea blandensis MED297]
MFGWLNRNKAKDADINAVVLDIEVPGVNNDKNQLTQCLLAVGDLQAAYLVCVAHHDSNRNETDIKGIRLVIDGSPAQVAEVTEKLKDCHLNIEFSGVTALTEYGTSVRTTIVEQGHNLLGGAGELFELTVLVKNHQDNAYQAILVHVGSKLELGDDTVQDVFHKVSQECRFYGMEVLDVLSNIQAIALNEYQATMEANGLPGDYPFARAMVTNQNAIIKGQIPLADDELEALLANLPSN